MITHENMDINDDLSFKTTKFLHSMVKGARNIFILWLLSKNKMHGYAIISKINEICDCMGSKLVHGSTIYPLLKSLENDGLIKSIEEYNGKHKVKTYEITEEGVKTLNLIKRFIKNNPNHDYFLEYFNDMIFSDEEFEYHGQEVDQ